MAFVVSPTTMNVPYRESFEINYSGAQGVVSAHARPVADLGKVSDLTVTPMDDGAGIVSGDLTILASTGGTIVITVTDTYTDEEGQETTASETCTITVVASDFITNLDDYEDSDLGYDGTSTFGRQQALCENQLVLAKKINTVRNFMLTSLGVQVASVLTQVAALSAQINDVAAQLDELVNTLPSAVADGAKNEVNYGR
jgi:hypothetical protein